MIPPAQAMINYLTPSERFTTTYQKDFKPMKVSKPMKTRTQAGAALSSSLQAWPTSVQCINKTTNSTYGSAHHHSPLNSVSQHPSGSSPPSVTPFVPSEGQMIGSTLKEDAGQETGHSLDEGNEDRQCFICAKNGMIRWDKFLSFLNNHHLNCPVSRPSFTQSDNKDAENQESSSCDLNPVLDQQSRTSPQPSSSCACEDQHQGCTKMQQVCPRQVHWSTPQPLFELHTGISCWKPLQTEYQANFGAQRIRLKIHQTVSD